MKGVKIDFLQLLMIFVMSTGLINHVILIPVLLESSGRDSWITSIIATLLALLWCFLPAFIIKKMDGKHVRDWLKDSIGSLFAYLLIGLLVAFLFIHFFATLFDLIYWTKASYLPNTPVYALAIPILVFCALNAMHGIRSVGRMSSLLLPFVILFGIFVAMTNIPRKDYTLLKPILEHGIHPILDGMIYASTGFLELFLVVLLHHRVSSSFSWKKFALLVLLLLGLTLGPLTGAIIEFGPAEAARLRYPAFEEWRLVRIGDYIEHLDFLSIYQWIAGAYIRMSLLIYLITEMFIPEDPQHQKQRTWMLFSLIAVSLLVFMLPISDMVFIDWQKKFILPATCLGMLFFSFLFAILALLRKKEEGKEDASSSKTRQIV